MKKLLLFMFSSIFLTAAAETDPEKPVQLCFDSSGDCALLLIQNSKADFVVDNERMFDAVRSIHPESFRLGVRLVSPPTKQEMEAAARETQDILRVTNEDLVKLQREGMAAISAKNGCTLLISGCGTTIGGALASISKNAKLAASVFMVGAVITCIQTANSCSDAFQALDNFREDFKTWEAKMRVRGHADPIPHGRSGPPNPRPLGGIGGSGGGGCSGTTHVTSRADGSVTERIESRTDCPR